MKTEDIVLSDAAKLIKEWKDLNHRGRDLEFEKARWCRKLRKRFRAGYNGDQDFRNWCALELSASADEALLMQSMAIAGFAFGDSVEYAAAGGERALECLVLCSPSEQESIMRTAKEQALSMRTVWAQRNKEPKKPMRSPVQDARRLAEYLIKSGRSLPAPVREIVARYVPLERRP